MNASAAGTAITWTEGGRVIGGEPVAEITGERDGARLIGRYYPKRLDAAVCAGAIRERIVRILGQQWQLFGTYWLVSVTRGGGSYRAADDPGHVTRVDVGAAGAPTTTV